MTETYFYLVNVSIVLYITSDLSSFVYSGQISKNDTLIK